MALLEYSFSICGADMFMCMQIAGSYVILAKSDDVDIFAEQVIDDRSVLNRVEILG